MKCCFQHKIFTCWGRNTSLCS